MFDTLKRDAILCAWTTAMMLAVATPSVAQPTEAQKEAVKSACRSDYMARCSSVTPGGEAALQCLAKNMSSLSSGCQSAVKAVEAALAHRLFEAARRAKQVRREASLVDHLPDGTVVEGVIDLAFETDEGWVVVEFKTDASIDESLSKYEAQVLAYVAALARATGQAVSGFILRV